jgi:thermosome
MDIEHPAAKMIIEVAKTQEQHCYDGTTSAVVLSGELLKRSEDLIEQNVHPTVICEGFRLAAEKAVGCLESHGISTKNDNAVLMEVAKTSLTGKSAGAVKSFLADICVRAVNSVGTIEDGERMVDLSDIKVEKRQGGSIKDSTLVDGIILDKERVHAGMPRSVSGAKIALINSAIEVKKTEVDAKIQITDPSMLASFLEEEENYIRGLVEKIQASGANAIVCQKGIDDLAQHYMSKAGIFAIRRAKKSDMEALSKATGGRVVTNIDDLTFEDLGAAAKVEERKIGESDMTFITGCPEAKSVSVLLRGGTEHVVDEIRRAFDDAVGVVSVAWEDGAVLTGGGSVLAALSRDLRAYAESIGGREQMAIEAFASALEIIPRTLAENAGLDPVTTIIELRKSHADGKVHSGINVEEGGVMDMFEANVLEPQRVVEQAIQSATETAIMILRIDDVISSKGVSGGDMMGGMDDFHM